MFEVGFFGEMAMLKNLISISALTVSLFVFGTGRPGLLQQDHAVIGGAIPECNASYSIPSGCAGTGCPTGWQDWTYTYWGSEDTYAVPTDYCSLHTTTAGLICSNGGTAGVNDTVHGNCIEYFWDWVLP